MDIITGDPALIHPRRPQARLTVIRFNQNDASFMVTAGDRIAWWNLDLMPGLRAKKPTGEKRQEKTTSGGPVSGRRRLSSTGAGLFT